MKLSREQLTRLFNVFLKEYLLKRSTQHLPMFDSVDGGKILTTRLYKILRDKELNHLVRGDDISADIAYEYAEKFLKEHKKIYIVGLNYWISLSDLYALRSIYESLDI